jgi:hypothetical protein
LRLVELIKKRRRLSTMAMSAADVARALDGLGERGGGGGSLNGDGPDAARGRTLSWVGGRNDNVAKLAGVASSRSLARKVFAPMHLGGAGAAGGAIGGALIAEAEEADVEAVAVAAVGAADAAAAAATAADPVEEAPAAAAAPKAPPSPEPAPPPPQPSFVSSPAVVMQNPLALAAAAAEEPRKMSAACSQRRAAMALSCGTPRPS